MCVCLCVCVCVGGGGGSWGHIIRLFFHATWGSFSVFGMILFVENV